MRIPSPKFLPAIVAAIAFAPAALAQSSVTIEQIGDRLRADTVQQEGSRKDLGLRMDGDNILSEIGQTGQADASLGIDTSGVDNIVKVQQSGDLGGINLATILQLGDRNSATVGQIAMSGSANEMSILQSGQDNIADLSQNGSGNALGLVQNGDANFASLHQVGYNLSLQITQLGGGQIVVTQTRP